MNSVYTSILHRAFDDDSARTLCVCRLGVGATHRASVAGTNPFMSNTLGKIHLGTMKP